eukprot:COSAG02_NODE_57719_length_279_cov_1.505556_1_plen_68_part_01
MISLILILNLILILKLYATCIKQLYGRCRQNAVNCMDAVGTMQSIVCGRCRPRRRRARADRVLGARGS